MHKTEHLKSSMWKSTTEDLSKNTYMRNITIYTQCLVHTFSTSMTVCYSQKQPVCARQPKGSRSFPEVACDLQWVFSLLRRWFEGGHSRLLTCRLQIGKGLVYSLYWLFFSFFFFPTRCLKVANQSHQWLTGQNKQSKKSCCEALFFLKPLTWCFSCFFLMTSTTWSVLKAYDDTKHGFNAQNFASFGT